MPTWPNVRRAEAVGHAKTMAHALRGYGDMGKVAEIFLYMPKNTEEGRRGIWLQKFSITVHDDVCA